MAIGLCGAATYILQSTNIIDTVIHFMSGLLQGCLQRSAACGMFVVQNILNILIPSGSGQAAVTMPIMAPLSDVLGSDKADGGSGIPVRRFIYKRSHPYLCNSDGSFINGHTPGEMDQVPGSALRSVGGDNLCVPNFCGKGWIQSF